jgi:phage terminase large subunit-like protein
MTKTEIKEALEKYRLESKRIQLLSSASLFKETTAEQEARIKHLLKPENYLEYFEYYYGVNSGLALADAPCAKFHLTSYLELFKNPLIKQQRRWFRGAAKSIHTNVGNLTHLKENNEVNFGLIIGRTLDAGKLLLSDVQMHLESNERYIKDFGMQMQYGSWADGQFETNDKKMFKALGLNQPFRGLRNGAWRPDFASMDDLEDRKQAKNIDITKENVQKLTGDLGKAGQKGRFRQVMANNYIVKNGIVDGYAEKNKKSPNLKISTVNLCDHNFKPSWPERYTLQECKDIVNDTDYHTSQREDFNNPVEEGKRIKEEWIHYKKTHGNQIHNGLIEFWDLSYSSDGDFKAGALVSLDKGRAHVLEIFNQQCTRPEAMNVHYEWQKKYNEKGMSIISYYDATAAQKIVYEPDWLIACEENNAAEIPFDDHASGDKHERIDATLTSTFKRGLITFDERLKDETDTIKAIEHILAFEKGCKTPDDILDALEQCVRKGRLLFGYSQKEDSNQKPVIGKRKTTRRV